jgi:CRISPR/Cas system-associated endoribonuclease Cas2
MTWILICRLNPAKLQKLKAEAKKPNKGKNSWLIFYPGRKVKFDL